MPFKTVTELPTPSAKINLFPPKIQKPNSTDIPTMAVCVKPLHFEFDKSVWFVEFIEMYRLQGATHFFFYDHSVSENVSKVLSHYVRLNMATVLPWSLPLPSQKMIRTEGMFTAISDCILR
jgi:hypothetical protein